MTTPITLPSWVSPQDVKPVFHFMGSNNEPINGGTITITTRPGSKWGVTGNLPPLSDATDGPLLLSRMVQAKSNGLRFPWVQLGDDLTGVDSATFSLSGSLGTSVGVSGVAGGVTIPEGRFFCFEQAGRSYLHQVVSFVDNVLTFEPELRVATVSGTSLEFNDVVIDGVLMTKDYAWDMWLNGHYGLPFSLKERW